MVLHVLAEVRMPAQDPNKLRLHEDPVHARVDEGELVIICVHDLQHDRTGTDKVYINEDVFLKYILLYSYITIFSCLISHATFLV